ncbi:MAG: dihydroorotate dehydrogenase electron transfer subunit [Ruminococcaceae bacterium]|nr:dihydroorotate dehydrogenase electron transfer subunit [Oscillospiraceae bacterium]
MKDLIFTIETNKKIAKNTYEMVLLGDTTDIKCGQFVNIKLDGFYLRRPISVCDVEGDRLTIIYKVVGAGTEAMAEMGKGTQLLTLTGLGNGYNTEKSGDKPLLVGGGAGVPPMYKLCRELVAQGKKPSVILGFNSAEEVFYEDKFKALGATVIVATADGSYGVKGFVTDAFDMVDYTYFYTCGPEPMLKAVYNKSTTSGQFSFEERMGCGFGACMGCSCKTKYGNKRICKDGPVLEKEEIIW